MNLYSDWARPRVQEDAGAKSAAALWQKLANLAEEKKLRHQLVDLQDRNREQVRARECRASRLVQVFAGSEKIWRRRLS